MKNTLADLNNYLFESLERLNDDSMDDEQLSTEIKRSEAVSRIANQIIDNQRTQLQIIKHMDEYGHETTEIIKPMLRISK